MQSEGQVHALSGPTAEGRGELQVKKAWGFSKLYDKIPYRDRAEARQCVHSYFGRGNGPYYRVHHGENMLSPKQQADILAIIAKFCPIDEVKFDHYVTDWDYSNG